MITLAIDTASEYASLAITYADKTDYILEQVGNKQSESILSNIHKLLTRNNLAISDVQQIVYNQGPGGFTGLRIAISVAKALAFANNIPLIPVNAFAMYTYQDKVAFANKVIISLDARLSQVYLAGIDKTDNSYFISPQTLNPQQAIETILNNTCDALVVNGLMMYPDKCDLTQLSNVACVEMDYPRADILAKLVKIFPSCSSEEADILYVRNKVALNLEEQIQLRQMKTLASASVKNAD